MSNLPGQRLAITGVILLLQIVAFAVDISSLRVRTLIGTRRYNAARMIIVPAAIAMLSAVLVSVTFSNLDGTSEMDRALKNSQCTTIDADVAGVGARSAVWAQIGILLVVSMLGGFHAKATGVKEVGTGIILTHISFVIALLVQLFRETLSPADAVIGAMIADAQNIAMAIQLSAKETLAARWQVAIATITQITGLAVLPVLIIRFNNGATTTGLDCDCLTVFWWAWLSNCQALPTTEISIFWAYYACRCIGFCQVTFYSVKSTQKFHQSEKFKWPLNPDTSHVLDYDQYPATVTFMFAFYGLLAIVSMATAETTMKTFAISPSSPITSVGQIIGLVVAGSTILHALWQFQKLFKDQKKDKNFDFNLPLSLQTLRESWTVGPSVTYSDLRSGLNFNLGYIFDHPLPISPPLIDDPTLIPNDLIEIPSVQEGLDSTWSSTLSISLGSLKFYHFQDEIHVKMSQLKVRLIELTEAHLRQLPDYRRLLPRLSDGRVIYIVTGIQIASGLKYETRFTKSFTLPCFGKRIPTVAGRPTAWAEPDTENEGPPIENSFPEDVIWAYRMRVIHLDQSRQVLVLGSQYWSSRWHLIYTFPRNSGL